MLIAIDTTIHALPAPAPPRPPIVLKFIEIIFYALESLNAYKFYIFSDLNNVESGLELENVISNDEFDCFFYDLCNGYRYKSPPAITAPTIHQHLLQQQKQVFYWLDWQWDM